MSNKKKVLCWSDSPVVSTGFGVVSKHVIGALHATGKYDIHQLAINFHGEFVDEEQVPWQVRPAKLLDPKDPHGLRMFAQTVMKNDYDIVWILNDLFVTQQIAGQITKIREQKVLQNKKVPKFIYYYPVDCHVQADVCDMLNVVDIPVCYTQHGREETLKTNPHLVDKLVEIPHGVDSSVYQPLSKADIARWKQEFLSVSPDTFVVMSSNRNSLRKQIPYSILAFREFRKVVPNSIMYCHTAVVDQGSDLRKALSEFGMSPQTDVVFPGRYSPSNSAAPEIMNRLYNIGDMFLTTHLGEGWGLTVTEAMAAGVPVVAPNNTCMPQQLGDDNERGYLYPCKDLAWIDNSGFRKKGLIPDIVDTMLKSYDAGWKHDNPKVVYARDWAVQHDWETVTQQWVELFENCDTAAPVNTAVLTQEV